MLRCPTCSADLVEGSRACRVCGTPLPADILPTITSTTSGVIEGRFPIGAVVVERYRILGLLGHGGMGEVYRAHDIKLDQQVALKFLPDALGRDGAAVARFHNEVRTARQVTHANVCRVHDIGDANGVPFISMEFIDGEDLASLLHRIGRLPEDKGIEIAQALCAGLAAAHARGVLHRDLKPANIMLNRAGRVLITDFGLAGVAARFRGVEVASGTPAYMAPEQLQGRAVTMRSDIYALGLVLHEIFTGRRVFTGTARGVVTAPSHLVKDLSPAIDRIVLACLNDDPQRRPASAMAVSQALPGGDPVVAAMRAGQTPSPEMVAAFRPIATFSVRAATACFAAVIALLAVVYVMLPRYRDFGLAPLETPPEALVARARDIARSAGYDARPTDYAFGFERDQGHLDYLQAHGFDWDRLADVRPGTFLWWYRQSPKWLSPLSNEPAVAPGDPPPGPGELQIVLDAPGRQLLTLQAFAGETGGVTGKTGTEPDWRPLFDAAGLDISRFAAATPGSAPAGGFDVRHAWLGSVSSSPDVRIRVEAAALDGRAVLFAVFYPWSRGEAETIRGSLTGMPAVPMYLGIVFSILIVCALLVRRNYRLGRLDIRGAATIGAVVFWSTMAAWVLRAHYTPTADMVVRLTQAVGTSLFTAAVTFICYAGIDPYARRHWPASLVSWTRLVSGKARDPLVGQDVLVGVLVGLAMPAVWVVYFAIAHALGARPAPAVDARSLLALTVGQVVGRSADFVSFALGGATGGLAMLLMLKGVVRSRWGAIVGFAVLGAVAWAPALGPSYPLLAFGFMSASFVLWVWMNERFGLLAGAVAVWVSCVSSSSLTWNPSLWYGPNWLLAAVLILALAVYGFRTTLAGRPLFRGGVFGDEDATP